MKATYNGVSMEGTPKEIAECKRLIDEQHAKPANPYQPYPYQPYWMNQPWTQTRYNGDTYTTGTATGTTIKAGGNIGGNITGNVTQAGKWIDGGYKFTVSE